MPRFITLCLCVPLLLLWNQHLVGGVKRNPKMTYLENDYLKIGADLSIGGSITYLSKKDGKKEGPNMVNSYDWGRQIQMSFYSGPQPFEPNGKKPHSHWKQLGWNPIQSGDASNNPSKVLKHSNDGKEIYVKTIPMHWPLNNQPGQCIFESWIKIEENIVHIKSKLTNARDDKTQYPGRNQEVPALYSNAPWYRNITYTGDKPYTGGELVEISRKPETPPFPWNRFQATEEWTALVDKNDEGFGVWSPKAQEYLGGFAGKPGKGGTKSSPTNYVSPLQTEILDHNIEHAYEYKLIVGSVKTIRDYVYANRSESKGLNYTFKEDRQHWYYRNAIDTGFPIKNELHLKLDKNNPMLISPLFCLEAKTIQSLRIRAAFTTGEKKATLIWVRHGEKKPVKGDAFAFPIKSDGKMRTYEVKLSGTSNWNGTIIKLMLKPCRKGADNKRLRIEYIRSE